MSQTYDIRCPLQVKNRHGQTTTCNKLTVRVEAGSRGQAFCNYCRKEFSFEIGGRSRF